MKAILFATGRPIAGASAAAGHRPAALLPLGDRPFVRHVVEHLVGRGVTDIDAVLSLYPELFTELLGDGARWGCRVVTRLVRSEEHPYGVLRALDFAPDTMVLIGHADRLPEGIPIPCPDTRPHAVLEPGGETGTGWGWVPAAALGEVQPDWDEAAFCEWLAAASRAAGTTVPAGAVLSSRAVPELLSSQALALGGAFPGLLLDGSTADPGIRLCRNVVLHPTARLVPPVFVGPDCNIGRGVVLGPNAAVQEHCVLDDRCSACDSLILAGSYVGENLELSEVLVDRNRLLSAKYGTELTVDDDFILGGIRGPGLPAACARFAARVPAALLFLLCLPLLVAAALWRRVRVGTPVVCRRSVLRLPVSESGGGRNRTDYVLHSLAPAEAVKGLRAHFLFVFLPGLVQVILGRLSMVGIAPVGAAEVEAMSDDRRRLCLGTKAGLVTEALLVYGPGAGPDERYSAEAFYAVHAGVRYDARLLLKYAVSLLLPGPTPRPTVDPEDTASGLRNTTQP